MVLPDFTVPACIVGTNPKSHLELGVTLASFKEQPSNRSLLYLGLQHKKSINVSLMPWTEAELFSQHRSSEPLEGPCRFAALVQL